MKKILVGIFGLFFTGGLWAATLPAGYTELEYIESTGTQYIDSGAYITSNNLLVKTKIYSTSTSTNEQDVFGNQDSTTGRMVFGLTGTGNNWFLYSRYGSAAATPNVITPAAQNQIFNIEVHIENGQKWLVVDGVATATETATDITNSNATVQLFADGKTTVNNAFKGRMYYFQMYDNGTLVRNFVPAKNSSGVVGMYDTVNNVFYTNQGTGEFTAGPEVLNPCRNLFDATPYKTGYYINESGVEQSADAEQYIIRQAVVQPGTQYTLSFVVTQPGYTQRYHAYDANGNWLSQVTTAGGTDTLGTKVTKTFTTPANTKYIRQGGKNQTEYQLERGSTATTYTPYDASCHNTNSIKIATTAYNSARFSPVVNDLNDTIATIRDVVTNTINQTKAIADLQATKQTRPDEQCPAGKKCLLVEDNDGTPHWYEIIESAD